MPDLLNRFRSDEALMLAYQQGDCAAFECLYHRHKNGLYAFLYRSCQQAAQVDELAQETWMGVIRAAPDYRPRAGFRTWLYQIARNRLVDGWRRERELLSLEEVPESARVDPPGQRAGEVRGLMAAIGRLPAEQRDALLLQQQGFTVREVASITGVGAETVKSRLRYARSQLREAMGGVL